MSVASGLNLRIHTIADRGNPLTERIDLEVLRDCDLQFNLLMATIEYMPGKIYAGGRPCFWFGPQQVSAGDHVIVYTRKGTNTAELRKDGHLNYFFFWELTSALLQFPTARVVVTEINRWETGG